MSTAINDSAGDAALLSAEREFFDLTRQYDRLVDYDSAEADAVYQRLDEVQELILKSTPPQTLAGAAAQLRCLREMIRRDWDDYLAEGGGKSAGPARKRFDVPVLRQVIALLEREAQS